MQTSTQPAPAEQGPDSSRHGILRELLTVRISSLSELLRRSSTLANRRETGLSWIEWRVMAQAFEHAPLSLNDLAELLNLDPGQVSRAVKGMASRGLLCRERRPGGPAVMITGTAAGKVLHARMVDLAIARNAFLVSEIPSEEIEQVIRVLDAVRGRAQLRLERERAAGSQQDNDSD